MPVNIGDLLSHPLVLKSAWDRVKNWYRLAELRPEPEYFYWEVYPEEQLLSLGEDLAKGIYSPDPFPLVPYPKEGAAIRHYTMPSVRDQVAFTALGILLAPILELQIPSFVFGNRWYRSIYRDNTATQNCNTPWTQLPFSLGDKFHYNPYRRSHGLYRRSCHWSSSHLLGVDPTRSEDVRYSVKPDDYAKDTLPPFVHKEWWEAPNTSSGRGYWVQLDLQLAYPSVDLDYLRQKLLALMNVEDEPNDTLIENSVLPPPVTKRSLANVYDGYPVQVWKPLVHSRQLRRQAVETLIGFLKNINYTYIEPGKDLWLPPHTDQQLPTFDNKHHIGLPTGLAISGLLMNAYLHGLDNTVADWLSINQTENAPAAFYRFADDMTLLCSTKEKLIEGIEMIWKGIADDQQAILSDPKEHNRTNLRINWQKVEPTNVRNHLKKYLHDSGWENCPNDCGALLPHASESNTVEFSHWWQSQSAAVQKDLGKHSLRRDDLGPFVTHLVERLSALGSETLEDRFGSGCSARLNELHQLIRYKIDDLQVRTDTRLLFTANRLAQAWLPDEEQIDAGKAIEHIRLSIGQAVIKVPWKFRIWRSVVRAAIRGWTTNRAPLSEEWLISQLKLIADTPQTEGSWHNEWPETVSKCNQQPHNNSNADWKSYYLSFLRASFWRALADSLQDLSSLAVSMTNSSGEDHKPVIPNWSPRSWTFRAIDESSVLGARQWLSNIDRWYLALYPHTADSPATYSMPPWEYYAFIQAVLATIPQGRLLSSIKTLHPNKELPAPSAQALCDWTQLSPALLRLASKHTGKVAIQSYQAPIGDQLTSGPPDPWLLLCNSQEDESTKVRLAKAAERSTEGLERIALCLADGLRVSRYCSTDREGFWSSHLKELLLDQESDSQATRGLRLQCALSYYNRARKVVLGSAIYQAEDIRRPTIHRLLWSEIPEIEDIEHWQIRPAVAPTLGLPARVSLRMLSEALDTLKKGKRSSQIQSPPKPPCWQIVQRQERLLSLARRLQLGLRSQTDIPLDLRIPVQAKQANTVESKFDVWEVPPHPAFYLPWALGYSDGSDKRYQLWCHLLLFFTAITGAEQLLDQFFDNGVGVLPFEQRWKLRSQINMPTKAWEALNQIRQWFTREANWASDVLTLPSLFLSPDIRVNSILQTLRTGINEASAGTITISDFEWQRIDISLDPENEKEIIQSARNWLEHIHDSPVNSNDLIHELEVRIGQIQAYPDWTTFMVNALAMSRSEQNNIMRQVHAVFSMSDHRYNNSADRIIDTLDSESKHRKLKDHLIIFPEATIPIAEVQHLIDEVRATGYAALAGCQFQELPTVVPHNNTVSLTRRFIVNEAILSLPLGNSNFPGPSLVRSFHIRKPIISHVESGLADALRTTHSGTVWQFVPGTLWYRFLHRRWGDFSVAICSDLLDSSPWSSMRGELLHIFMCSYNSDVDLYELLTWIRAYENFVNVVATNHGEYGGSFAWSPKHSNGKELANFRGANIFLAADITIPVLNLFKQQRIGTHQAIKRAAYKWKNPLCKFKQNWKSPPPGFPGRKQ